MLFYRVLYIHFGARYLYLLINYFLITDTHNFVIIYLEIFMRALSTDLIDKKKWLQIKL